MMKQPYRVLSIDFDYFQNTTMHTVKNYYPDGIDLPTDVTSIVWSSMYSKSSLGYQAIQDVTINQALINQAKVIMEAQRDIPVVIRNSHLHIWREIENRCVRGQSILLTHIDFHDDMTNGNEKFDIVDCGNWLHFLMRFYNTNFYWFTRKTATECYGIDPKELPIFVDDLTHLMYTNQQYDFIFICRSDPWLPPHLDADFDKLVDFCERRFSDVDVEDTAREPRSMASIMEMAKQIDDCYQQIMIGGGN